MLPLVSESKGIYSQYSQPLAKQSAGITWSWTGLAIGQSQLWIKDFRATVLSCSVSSRWVCVWEYRTHGNCDLLSKAGLLLVNPSVGELGGKAKDQEGISDLQTLLPLR